MTSHHESGTLIEAKVHKSPDSNASVRVPGAWFVVPRRGLSSGLPGVFREGFVAHSLRVLPYLAVGVLTLAPQLCGAQGWRDRIKKAVINASGLGELSDMKELVRGMKNVSEATKHPSLLAGTYRLTYVYNGTDSIVYYVRTFERPDIGTVGGPSTGMEGGYLLTTVAAASREALPTRWQDARNATSKLGGGPMVVLPFVADADGTHAFNVNWQVDLKDESKEWRKRKEDMFGDGELIDTAGNRLPATEASQRKSANTILARDGSVRVEIRIRRKKDRLVEHAERLSGESYTNEGKPTVPGIAVAPAR